MEFEFIRNTLMGEYYVKSSMGHEIVGRWLQEEIGKDWQKIAQVESLLTSVHQSPLKEHAMLGTEISILIQGDEVTVQENVLAHGDVMEEGSELNFYNSESIACCGLDDFELVLEQWKEFLTTK
ncbi:YacL family protein [Vibrio sp. Isolate25]|uniref:YacL family protein n=1 Tax=Vibrio sp. Isolate25 TaxID=2908535 RepID=UPI001EFC94C8|nr:YacL family protein [Vibrio sp. Isolate25]MCG9596450.1 YacL family protein [Vibrio sp. Isolate25]